MATEREFDGTSVQEAIRGGLRSLGVQRDDIEVKILDEGSSGLFGLVGAKPARVRLRVTGQPPASEAAVPDPLRDTAHVAKAAETLVCNVLRLMGFPEAVVACRYDKGAVHAQITGCDKTMLIGRNGQVIQALQFIASLMLSRDPATRVRLFLDIDGYQERQRQRQVEHAIQVADSVRRTGTTAALQPMSSQERLAVHMALKDDADVETYSDGRGASRTLYIRTREKQ